AQRRIASTERSASASVVLQFDTEIRIAARPCHVVPPSQHVPSSWTAETTRRVNASVAASSPPPGGENRTSTWLSTTSFRIVTPSADLRPPAIRRASEQHRP